MSGHKRYCKADAPFPPKSPEESEDDADDDRGSQDEDSATDVQRKPTNKRKLEPLSFGEAHNGRKFLGKRYIYTQEEGITLTRCVKYQMHYLGDDRHDTWGHMIDRMNLENWQPYINAEADQAEWDLKTKRVHSYGYDAFYLEVPRGASAKHHGTPAVATAKKVMSRDTEKSQVRSRQYYKPVAIQQPLYA